ncbi:MAG: hypothetical protein ACE5LU_26075, partial [Anaerolineae bacterium]
QGGTEARAEGAKPADLRPCSRASGGHARPAYIPALKSAGIKWVSGFPENYRRGLPYITGLLILNDPETGLPISVVDCVWITAMREVIDSGTWDQPGRSSECRGSPG